MTLAAAGIVLANMVRVDLTASVYLGVALPICLVLLLLTRRPIIAGLVGAMLAMLATALLRYQLPFDFWAHGNDFIIEPFAQGRIVRHPVEGLLSLLFHVGVPVLLTLGAARIIVLAKSSLCSGNRPDLRS